MPAADTTARSMAPGLAREGERLLQICNACRYCEGYCAVFPAIERRLTFTEADLGFLANLCHDCGECYDACQYAPPHEFAVDLPRTLGEIRRETYRAHAWPRALGSLFTRSGLVLSLAAAGMPAAVLLVLAFGVEPAVLFSAHADRDGAFYQVVPHEAMVAAFGTLGIVVAAALLVGLTRFWRHAGGPAAGTADLQVLRRAASDAMTLRYLDGGGAGCTHEGEEPSRARRRYHHLTFYGFLSCFAATSVAAFYHNVLGWQAPYALTSIPVVLGCLGGAGLVIGPAGLLGLQLRVVRGPRRHDRAQAALDVTFLVMLLLTSLSGFLLLVLRESRAMGVTLAVHLGLVAGVFLTMPYGKFVHGLYRFAALVRHAHEAGSGVGRRTGGEGET